MNLDELRDQVAAIAQRSAQELANAKHIAYADGWNAGIQHAQSTVEIENPGARKMREARAAAYLRDAVLAPLQADINGRQPRKLTDANITECLQGHKTVLDALEAENSELRKLWSALESQVHDLQRHAHTGEAPRCPNIDEDFEKWRATPWDDDELDALFCDADVELHRKLSKLMETTYRSGWADGAAPR